VYDNWFNKVKLKNQVVHRAGWHLAYPMHLRDMSCLLFCTKAGPSCF